MGVLPWTKFQDFYLRLGFLKVLVAALDPGRRSTGSDLIVQKLQARLFGPVRHEEELWHKIQTEFQWFASADDPNKPTTVSEALLVIGRCPSALYAITPKTAYKIVDWARDVRLVGPGYQITEFGLLLRKLLSEEKARAFLAGDLLGWNPFDIQFQERLFFLQLLCEIDELTVAILDDLGAVAQDTVIESSDAAEITCRAFLRILDDMGRRIPPTALPELRKARELAHTMAVELQLPDFDDKQSDLLKTRPPAPIKVGSVGPRGDGRRWRRTTKNADHQTIPRFEQLVDLGFLTKPDYGHEDPKKELASRKRWRYLTTSACRAWSQSRRRSQQDKKHWQWKHFAETVFASYGMDAQDIRNNPGQIAVYTWLAYNIIHRPFGHTPLHSVALIAMITAASDGYLMEMEHCHNLMLSIKQNNLLPDHAFFASGNELDRMFILLRPGFLDAFNAALRNGFSDSC